ncbi:hypothetical protein LOAG_08579 [Loa loa]|uniref:Uncharacterized protein n=1 Tax=Loa loa TaxID=7209 RepID=A0A1S0TTI6_LOALO|nr:hypothetical protein LOAG_08579 [Loa loa]EFO19914.1 hypothetical protein LOAG_08579 [Loa loa]
MMNRHSYLFVIVHAAKDVKHELRNVAVEVQRLCAVLHAWKQQREHAATNANREMHAYLPSRQLELLLPLVIRHRRPVPSFSFVIVLSMHSSPIDCSSSSSYNQTCGTSHNS